MKEHVKNVRIKKDSRNRSNNDDQTSSKKPFDKKKYRLKKYSNKYKINQWEDRRKKAILRDYYKEVDKTQRHDPDKIDSNNEAADKSGKTDQQRKMSAYYKAKQEFLRKKNEKKRKHEEAQQVKAEREEALQKYKEKKMQAFKKLSKKTKKGQPVMKGRIEMLLEKIQNQAFE